VDVVRYYLICIYFISPLVTRLVGSHTPYFYERLSSRKLIQRASRLIKSSQMPCCQWKCCLPLNEYSAFLRHQSFKHGVMVCFTHARSYPNIRSNTWSIVWTLSFLHTRSLSGNKISYLSTRHALVLPFLKTQTHEQLRSLYNPS
jgi:hypothetical protein